MKVSAAYCVYPCREISQKKLSQDVVKRFLKLHLEGGVFVFFINFSEQLAFNKEAFQTEWQL